MLAATNDYKYIKVGYITYILNETIVIIIYKEREVKI